MNLGGRTDLFYKVKCYTDQFEKCSNVLYSPGSSDLTQTSVFVSYLKPYTSYEFRVFSMNGVSDIARTENYTRLYLTTKESSKSSVESSR